MYTIIEEKKILEGEEHTAYGIRYDNCCVSDVSDDRMAVERLIRDYNKYELDPIHLHDVIEDFLADL